MAWNGSGVFSRLYNWVTDRDSSIPITASRMDGEQDNIAAGINACLTKNGENSPSANLPMATYKHTGVGAANARTDYADVGSVQDGSLTYVVDSGAADAYVITLAPAITAYVTGAAYAFKSTNASTGASTLDINGVGAKTIKKLHDVDLAAGDIESGGIYVVRYDGTNMQLISPVSVASLQSTDMGVSVQAYDATIVVDADIGVSVQGYDADTAVKDVAGDWTKQQRIAEASLSDGANIAWDLDTYQEATVTLDGNRTLDNPTNQNAGGWYHLRIVQDAVTGSRTLTFDTAYKFGDAGEPTLSTAVDSEDVLAFRSNGTYMQYMGAALGVQA